MLAYLDHAASGPINSEAAEAMLPWITDRYGNPSGSHQVARAARAAIDEARERVAAFIGVDAGEVTFTSGGTEADNLAVLGRAAVRAGPLVVGATEHPAVLEAAAAATAAGHEVRIAAVGTDGVIDVHALSRLLDRTVGLVSIQLVNHETGVIQPFGEIARVVKQMAPNALLHTDAVQAARWLDLQQAAATADLVTISGHKLGGPQGVGALAARGCPAMLPIVVGGGQERELRSGTQFVAGIVGLGAAVGVVARARDTLSQRVAALRDLMSATVRSAVPGCVVTAEGSSRVPGHLHMRFPEVESEELLFLLDEAGVCASAGSACASGAMEPSPVLLAMGVDKRDALGSLRLSLGPSTTRDEVLFAAGVVADAVNELWGHR